MSYLDGDFVDCAFPFREHPARPETRHLHIGYVERTAISPNGTILAVLYTTTAAHPPGKPRRKGLIQVDERASKAMGMQRAFTIDAFRLLVVPLTERWFPDLNQPGRGVRGHAPETLQRHITRVLDRALNEREPLLDIFPRR